MNDEPNDYKPTVTMTDCVAISCGTVVNNRSKNAEYEIEGLVARDCDTVFFDGGGEIRARNSLITDCRTVVETPDFQAGQQITSNAGGNFDLKQFRAGRKKPEIPIIMSGRRIESPYGTCLTPIAFFVRYTLSRSARFI